MKKPVLVVDDPAGALQELSKQLTAAGYDVSRVQMDKALEQMTTVAPEIVLVQLFAGGGSGVTLAEQVRQRPDGAIVPIIFIGTGTEMVTSVSDALAVGGDYYFQHPLDLTKVVAKIRTYIGVGETAGLDEEKTNPGVVVPGFVSVAGPQDDLQELDFFGDTTTPAGGEPPPLDTATIDRAEEEAKRKWVEDELRLQQEAEQRLAEKPSLSSEIAETAEELGVSDHELTGAKTLKLDLEADKKREQEKEAERKRALEAAAVREQLAEDERKQAEARARVEAEAKKRAEEERAERARRDEEKRRAEDDRRRREEEDAREREAEEARRREEEKRREEERAKREEEKRREEERAKREEEKRREDERAKREEEKRREEERAKREEEKRREEERAKREEEKRREDERAKREEEKRREEERARREEERRRKEEEDRRREEEKRRREREEREEREREEAEARRREEEEREEEERRREKEEARRRDEEKRREEERRREDDRRRRSEEEAAVLRRQREADEAEAEKRKNAEMQQIIEQTVRERLEGEMKRSLARAGSLGDDADLSPPEPRAPSTEFGDLGVETDVAAVFAHLCNERTTGKVRFTKGDVEKLVGFENGRPVEVVSSDPRDRLEEFLLKEHLLTRPQYQTCRKKQLSNPRQMGAFVVAEGFVKASELFDVVRRHFEDVLHTIFEWEDGRFAYSSTVVPAEDRIVLPESPERVIADGIRRRYTLERLIKRLGGPSSLLVAKTDLALKLPSLGLDPKERQLTRLVDGAHSIEDLVFSTGLGEERVYQVLYILVAFDLAEVAVRGLEGAVADEHSVAIDRARITEKYEQAKKANYFEFLGLPVTATEFDIQRGIEAVRRVFGKERFPLEVATELKEELLEIERVLSDAEYVLRDPRLRDAYIRHMQRARAS